MPEPENVEGHVETPAVPPQGDPVPNRGSLSPEAKAVVEAVNQRYGEMTRKIDAKWKDLEEKHGPVAHELQELKAEVKQQFKAEAEAIADLEITQKTTDRQIAALAAISATDEPYAAQGLESQALDPADPRIRPEYKAAINAWLRAPNQSGNVRVGSDHAEVLSAGATYVEGQIRAAGDPTAQLSADWGPSGGFFSRPQFEQAVDRQVIDISPTRAYAMVKPVTGFQYVGVLRTDNIDAARQGSETGVRTVATEKARYIEYTIDLNEDYVYPAISYKAQQIPGTDLESELLDDAGFSFGQNEGTATTTGGGVGEAEGFMTNTLVEEIDSAVVGTIDVTDCLNLMFKVPTGGTRLNPAHRRRGMFAIGSDALADLMSEKDGLGNFMWRPSTVSGDPSLLHGRPWDEWPDMAAVATNAYPVAYADFRAFYRLAIRAGLFVVRVENPPLSQIHIQRYYGGRVWDFMAGKKLKVA